MNNIVQKVRVIKKNLSSIRLWRMGGGNILIRAHLIILNAGNALHADLKIQKDMTLNTAPTAALRWIWRNRHEND